MDWAPLASFVRAVTICPPKRPEAWLDIGPALEEMTAYPDQGLGWLPVPEMGWTSGCFQQGTLDSGSFRRGIATYILDKRDEGSGG